MIRTNECAAPGRPRLADFEPAPQPNGLERRGNRCKVAIWASRWVAAVVAVAVVVGTPIGGVQARSAPDSFADLAERLLPAVVNISTTQVAERQPGIEPPVVPPGSPFEEFFREFFERSQPREPRQRRATSLGSGFVVDASGFIVTNNHVIQDADEISVILHDETRLAAEVVGRDPKTDIAVLKVEPPATLSAITFGDSDVARVGDWVLAIGNPFGFGGTVTAGIISARSRDIQAGPYDDFLQTDASINRGNSGGPMFNLDGEVIGINTAIFSPSGGSVGIGFAIPVNVAEPVIRQLIAHGEVRRGWLGVRIQTVTEELAESFGLERARGALVADVMADGPAAAAGLEKGDVILQFDGRSVNEMRQLPRIVADTEVGRTVGVEVWRGGREITVDVTVGALEEEEVQVSGRAPRQQPGEPPSLAVDALGITVAEIDDNLREQFELGDTTAGVVVTDVEPGSIAGEHGIRRGDVIVEVGQQEVRTPADVVARVEEAREAGRASVLMLVEGVGGPRFVAVRIGQG
ncbi:MAG: DegQ family serine endoprotease [Rhodospirillales bacterium]|nr:MAG: DegQ family serine endoprotease [Rhodospirillales bacterium]